jgi:hypothetical protein
MPNPERSSPPGEDVVAVTAAQSQYVAAVEDHIAVSVRTWLDLEDAIKIDDRATVNAGELLLIEALGQLQERHAQ